MQTDLTEKETLLFDEWKKIRPELSVDGIICERTYLLSDLKILFIMKEVNSEKGFDLKRYIQEGGRDQTWNNVARWVYAIRNIEREITWEEAEKISTDEQRKDLLKSICVMNLKKSPGSHTTNINELWKIATEDKEFLNKQISIYLNSAMSKPDIIITCGTTTSEIFNKLIVIPNKGDRERTSRGIWHNKFSNNNGIILNYVHPEARVPDNLLFYGFIDAIKEINRKKKTPTTVKSLGLNDLKVVHSAGVEPATF